MTRYTSLHVFTLLLITTAAFATPPFPDALNRAAISVDKSGNIAYDALILGNGDINALLYTEGGAPALVLTKNDVWDARLDSKLDPPLPTLELLKRLGTSGKRFEEILEPGTTFEKPDSYHAHPYPCPRACARLIVGDSTGTRWRQIRAQGNTNAFAREGGAGVMRIDGAAGTSNGYACSVADPGIGALRRIRLTVRGSENARFFVELGSDQPARALFQRLAGEPDGAERDFLRSAGGLRSGEAHALHVD